MGSIKDRNGMDLTKSEDNKNNLRIKFILKVLKNLRIKNTQKNCTKKIFTTQIIMMV